MTDKFSRRRFLEKTAAGSAAISALGTLSSARGDDKPSEQVVLGVMGVNGRGRALSQEFAPLPGVKIAYICDVDHRAMNKAIDLIEQKTGRAPQGVGDFRRMLDDPGVDAIVIAAPDHWHAPATILACAAGKHVYVEKPACHNPHEGELMVQAARKHDRVVQLGTQRRSSPLIQEVVQKIRSGEIGTARMARGWINSQRPSIGHGKPVPVPNWLDWSLWQGPAPELPYRDNVVHYHWHWFWHWGTGELGNNGIHALDLCRWGLDVESPRVVTCGGGKLFFDDDQQTPDTQIATYNFGDKLINWEHRTWHPRGFEGQSWGATFYGDQGTVVIGGRDYVVYDIKGKERQRVKINRGEIEHLQNFVDSVRQKATPNAEIAEGVRSTLLCHLGNIALRTGQTVNYDPDQRKITGSPRAQALWQREYRSGWEPVV